MALPPAGAHESQVKIHQHYSFEDAVAMLRMREYLVSIQCEHLKPALASKGIDTPEQCAELSVAQLCGAGAGRNEVPDP